MLPRIPLKPVPVFNDTEDRMMSRSGPRCARHGGAHPRRVCVLCVWTMRSAKVKPGPQPVFFNEASKECDGWTGCVSEALPEPVNETSSLSGGVTGRLHVRLNLKNFIIRALTKRRVGGFVRLPKYFFNCFFW